MQEYGVVPPSLDIIRTVVVAQIAVLHLLLSIAVVVSADGCNSCAYHNSFCGIFYNC